MDHSACGRSVVSEGYFGLANEDVDKLKDMSPADMIDQVQYHEALQNSEEVKFLMYYIASLREYKHDTYYRLPPPPFVRRITASPNRNERFSKFLQYRRDGTPLSLRCLTDDHKWGRTEEALRQEAPGMLIYRRLNRPPTDIFGASPIQGVKFGSFRQLGFAFWDMWRMHLLGDGKADHIVQYHGGATRTYRNNGNILIGEGRKWNDMGTIAGGVSPQGPVHYADINGDRKADYLVVFYGGAINACMDNHDWALKPPDRPDQPIPTEPGEGGDGDEGSSGGGGDDDVVYIDPKIWDSKNPRTGCQPPCTLVLPPWSLSSKTTIGFPVLTGTLKETWPEPTNGVTKYRTTTITVRITLPPLTTSEIDVSNIVLIGSISKSIPVRGSL
ncbi:uncharacterized protein FTOL_11637 [Fusarium torulosum]|uniref:Uncharacterized protein n=1 Tax=Fusarium torulosum TaxID=33205 RepID=A0AAE8MKH7_9HYPO|nr:uncharacterized protein FTOL_11637 [Fusarium torulosum]